MRPLLKLANAKERSQTWLAAVDRAEGNQPTAIEVQEVVFEILHPGGPPEKLPPGHSGAPIWLIVSNS